MVALEKVLSKEDQEAQVDRALWHRATADETALRKLIEDHHRWTGSLRARDILDNWNEARAKFVKVFSIVGNKLMVNPKLPGGRATMFICGNNGEAKKEVIRILDQFGWDSEDMGRVEAARAIEPLCMLWCIPGILKNQWTHAFKLVKQ
jgi:predicted dinucleotide-binding enzyme